MNHTGGMSTQTPTMPPKSQGIHGLKIAWTKLRSQGTIEFRTRQVTEREQSINLARPQGKR